MSCYGPSVSDIRRPIREVTRHLPLLALLAAPLCGSAQAMNYEVGTSLICDTQTQVERFVALFSGDTQAAIDAVNAEEQNPTACALINAAYLRGAKIGMARNGDSAFEIVRIPGRRHRHSPRLSGGRTGRLFLAVRPQGVRGVSRLTRRCKAI